jgi:hypothetical protein
MLRDLKEAGSATILGTNRMNLKLRSREEGRILRQDTIFVVSLNKTGRLEGGVIKSGTKEYAQSPLLTRVLVVQIR